LRAGFEQRVRTLRCAITAPGAKVRLVARARASDMIDAGSELVNRWLRRVVGKAEQRVVALRGLCRFRPYAPQRSALSHIKM
jgi:hypothetical protein